MLHYLNLSIKILKFLQKNVDYTSCLTKFSMMFMTLCLSIGIHLNALFCQVGILKRQPKVDSSVIFYMHYAPVLLWQLLFK